MKMKIREATAGDLEDLAGISRTTWDGDDYLEKVSGDWIKQQGFFVGDVGGRVIGCGKITSLPGKVAWLEGLRVHKDFKGKGYGRMLSDEILGIAKKKVLTGEYQSIQFSTYINNTESVSMALKQGFRPIEFFHVLGLENPPMQSSSFSIEKFDPDEEDFSVYKVLAPCGWKYINPASGNSLDWMKANAEFWQVETGARFLTANRGSEISPLASSFEDPEGFVKGALALAEKKRLDYMEIMVHDSHTSILAEVVKNGFSYWDKHGVANLLIYKLHL